MAEAGGWGEWWMNPITGHWHGLGPRRSPLRGSLHVLWCLGLERGEPGHGVADKAGDTMHT